MKPVRFSREPIVIFGGLYVLLLEIKMCLVFIPVSGMVTSVVGDNPEELASSIPAVAASHFTSSSISPLAPFPPYIYSFTLFSFPVSYCIYLLQLSPMTLCLFQQETLCHLRLLFPLFVLLASQLFFLGDFY